MMNNRKKMFFTNPTPDTVYSDMSAGFSLRNLVGNWTKPVITIRRSSDDAEKNVFFDGNEITLNSFLCDLSDTIPTTTTLGTWIGSDDGYLTRWLPQIPNNIIRVNGSIGQTNLILQPKIINTGALNLYNGKVGAFFNSQFLEGLTVFELDSGNPFTIVSVSVNSSSNSVGTVFCNTNVSLFKIATYNDRRTLVRNGVIVNTSGTGFFVDNLAQDDTSNQKLQTLTVDNSGNIEAYKDGISQSTNTFTGSYINESFRMGSQQSGTTLLTGTVQELIIYPTDKTADLSSIHADINSYYTIY